MSRRKEREEKFCDCVGAEHVGGPGAPDCEDDYLLYDYKDWLSRPVSASDVREIAKKEWVINDPRPLIICSPNTGYTEGAMREAEKHDIILSCLRFLLE